MKIKRERQVRLDELLKYVWDNGINDIEFHSDNDSWVRIDDYGDLTKVYEVESTDLFTITEEVEITEDTRINLAYRIKTERGWQTYDKHGVTIGKIINIYKKHHHVYLGFIYLLNPDGSIGELIWSKECGLVE